MYVRDVARKEFYEALGLDARTYDRLVIIKTNETSARVFPVVLDVEAPAFWEGLEAMVRNNSALAAVEASGAPAVLRIVRKVPHWIGNGLEMARLFFRPVIASDRFQPAVR
jgi:magnesium-protoporphyrin IX monomethyl ester (oxidative) cyclase